LNEKTIDWLREGPSWLKYAVDKQLMQEDADIGPVLGDSAIIEIVRRLKDQRYGIPALGGALMDSDRFENPYWDLFFLADLGLSAADLNLQDEIERFLWTQSQDGTYITEPGMKPSYFCKSSIILASIAGLGFKSDFHIQKVVELLLKSQRLDGGWYCNPNHDIGASLQYEDSCPQENLNNLLLLGNYSELRSKDRFNGAIDLLMKHWEMRGTGIQIVYFGIGKRYQSLQYPATRYGIVRVLDVLSLYPYALKQNAFRNMLDFVKRKAVAGRYIVEIPTPYTSLESPDQYNRLLTFILSRVEKRVNDFDDLFRHGLKTTC
jgi:hypothetical protein